MTMVNQPVLSHELEVFLDDKVRGNKTQYILYVQRNVLHDSRDLNERNCEREKNWPYVVLAVISILPKAFNLLLNF